MDKNLIDDLAGKLADAVPGGLGKDIAGGMGDLRAELRENFHAVLQSGLDKLDLVTREEFEVQRKVLERTREKLERLETELEELQRDTINGPDSVSDDAQD